MLVWAPAWKVFREVHRPLPSSMPSFSTKTSHEPKFGPGYGKELLVQSDFSSTYGLCTKSICVENKSLIVAAPNASISAAHYCASCMTNI